MDNRSKRLECRNLVEAANRALPAASTAKSLTGTADKKKNASQLQPAALSEQQLKRIKFLFCTTDLFRHFVDPKLLPQIDEFIGKTKIGRRAASKNEFEEEEQERYFTESPTCTCRHSFSYYSPFIRHQRRQHARLPG